MKKRSKYRQKVQLVDPLNWVLSGLKPLTSVRDQMLKIMTLHHGALVAVTQGAATIDDADALLGAFNMAEALARLGQGADWLPEIEAAQQALRNAGDRPRFLFTGPELNAVNLAMSVHDTQLQDPNTTIDMLTRALAIVRKDMALKRSKPLRFPVQN